MENRRRQKLDRRGTNLSRDVSIISDFESNRCDVATDATVGVHNCLDALEWGKGGIDWWSTSGLLWARTFFGKFNIEPRARNIFFRRIGLPMSLDQLALSVTQKVNSDDGIYPYADHGNHGYRALYIFPVAGLFILSAAMISYGLFCCPTGIGVILVLLAGIPIYAAIQIFLVSLVLGLAHGPLATSESVSAAPGIDASATCYCRAENIRVSRLLYRN